MPTDINKFVPYLKASPNELGGHIIPTTNADFDLGNAEKKIRHLFLSDNSLHIGSHIVSVSASDILQYDGADIVFYDAVPNDNEVLTWDNSGSQWLPAPAPSGSTFTWEEATTSKPASIGVAYIVDTTAAPVTLTLPASAQLGDEIWIIDGVGNAENNNIICEVAVGGNMHGQGQPFFLDQARRGARFVYYNASQGWIISATNW